MMRRSGDEQPSETPQTPSERNGQTEIPAVSWFPVRFQIFAMIFASIIVSYQMRSSMSLNLIAMVRPIKDNTTAPDLGLRFDWTPMQQSLLLSLGFVGNVIVTIPYGILVDRFGHVRQLILSSFLVSAGLQFASPWAAAQSFTAIAFINVMIGIVQGGIIITAHKMITTWSPHEEMGIFTSAIMGTNLGTIVSWTISGVLIESYGWPSSFYFNGVALSVFCVFWWYLAYESPAEHPRITSAEKLFIESKLVQGHEKQAWPPIGSMLMSVPFWCLLLLQYGNLWGLYFLLTSMPKFVNGILGFELAGTGLLASLPYVARWLGSIGWAMLGQRIHSRSGWSLVNQRKFFLVFSHIVPGLLFIGMPLVSFMPYVCIGFLVLSQGCNGASPQSTFATFHNIAPVNAGSMVSIINTVGSVNALIVPLILGWLTAEKNTIAEWSVVFTIGAVGYIVPALVFFAFGSATAQPWDGGSRSVGDGEDVLRRVDKLSKCEHLGVADLDDRSVRLVKLSALSWI